MLEAGVAVGIGTDAANTSDGEGEIGRLAAGYRADIVFIDLGHVTYQPTGSRRAGRESTVARRDRVVLLRFPGFSDR